MVGTVHRINLYACASVSDAVVTSKGEDNSYGEFTVPALQSVLNSVSVSLTVAAMSRTLHSLSRGIRIAVHGPGPGTFAWIVHRRSGHQWRERLGKTPKLRLDIVSDSSLIVNNQK